MHADESLQRILDVAELKYDLLLCRKQPDGYRVSEMDNTFRSVPSPARACAPERHRSAFVIVSQEICVVDWPAQLPSVNNREYAVAEDPCPLTDIVDMNINDNNSHMVPLFFKRSGIILQANGTEKFNSIFST